MDHISEVCKKSSQRVGVIMRLRNMIPTAAKLQLYKAAILPYLTYCSVIWHYCREVLPERLNVSRKEPNGQYIVTETLLISSY